MEISYPTPAATTAAPAPGLTSEDLAPTTATARTWGTWNYAALWIILVAKRIANELAEKC